MSACIASRTFVTVPAKKSRLSLPPSAMDLDLRGNAMSSDKVALGKTLPDITDSTYTVKYREEFPDPKHGRKHRLSLFLLMPE